MNKTKFLELVKNPDLIEEKDLTKLDELISEHPYSQIIHVLKVKGRKALNKPDFNQSLNLAATYTYDRTILYSIVEGGVPGTGISSEISSTAAEQTAPDVEQLADDQSITEETSDFSWINEGDDEDIFIDEIPETIKEKIEEENAIGAAATDTEELVNHSEEPAESPVSDILEKEQEEAEESGQEEQHEQQEQEVQQAEEEQQEQQAEREQLEEEEQREEHHLGQELPEEQEPQKIEGQQKIAAEELQEQQGSKEHKDDEEAPAELQQEKEPQDFQEKEHQAPDRPDVSQKKEVKDPLDMEIQAGSIHAELMKNLSQLQESKQRLDQPPKGNGGPKSQKQQIEIIDNFIKNSPVLSKPNLNAESEAESQDDLSKTSTKLSDELASENLAKIYLKQGKRKDAEKIYKKLIRKFPQKKGYFADQIQKIKKK